jgi:prevent-host-death family protein
VYYGENSDFLDFPQGIPWTTNGLKERRMPRVVTSTELQKKTRDVVDWARIERDTIIVENHGKPVVAILSFDEYQRLVKLLPQQPQTSAA